MVTTGDILDVEVEKVTVFELFCRAGRHEVLVLIPETSWIGSYKRAVQIALALDE